IPSGRGDAIHTEPQGGHVAVLSKLNGLPSQRLGLPLQQRLSRPRCPVPRSLRLAGRVAGLSRLESGVLLSVCISRLDERHLTSLHDCKIYSAIKAVLFAPAPRTLSMGSVAQHLGP